MKLLLAFGSSGPLGSIAAYELRASFYELYPKMLLCVLNSTTQYNAQTFGFAPSPFSALASQCCTGYGNH
jgi:hypothetical protein